jgi:uncharacterized membrane protein YvlD (DUF360 family)
MGVGIFAVLSNLPKQMVWMGAYYFIVGAFCLWFAAHDAFAFPGLMAVPFGVGQLLTGGILHFAAREA